MSTTAFRHVYGPVPSRRLGRSLEYIPIKDVLIELEQKLAAGDVPDYISLAGSGEPTLNLGIGRLIAEIKRLTDIRVAILTNGSLLWMPDVQDALMAADLVLPSLDAGDERLFQYVNRPHEEISFERMVDGLATFTRRFPGEVWLEILLLWRVTGLPAEVEKIASLVERISPARVQLNTVSRPPAEEFAYPLSMEQMLAAKVRLPGVVDIISENRPDEVWASASHEARAADIMALLSRRPCTAADVAGGLGIHVTEALKHLEALMAARTVSTVVQGGRSFYVPAGSEQASRAAARGQ